MSDAATSLVVLAAAIGLFVWNRLPVGVVAVLTMLALVATGVVDEATALAGFGDPVVVFIAALFVLGEGLESAGVTAWAGQLLLDRLGERRSLLAIALMVLAALMAALVTPNGAAAALLPVMVLAARRTRQPTSRLAMPLAFAASAGALLTLSGSTVNVIVSEALSDATGAGFGYFEFAVVGLPLVLVTVAVAMAVGPRLLPSRTPSSLPGDFSSHLDTLVDHYRLDQGFFRLRVTSRSRVVGGTLEHLGAPAGVTVIGGQSRTGRALDGGQALVVDDRIVVSGPQEAVDALVEDTGLVVVRTPLTRSARASLLGRDQGLAEIVVPPRSSLLGARVFPGMVRSGATILGITRLGRDVGPSAVTLAAGDALLVHGPWPRVEALALSDDVLVVDSPELVRRQTVALGPHAARALVVLVLTVVLLASGVVSPAVASLVGAVLMVVTGVVSAPAAYRAVSWETVVLVGGLIPLSVAISTSGAADLASGLLVDVVPAGNGHALLAALFVLTAVLGQVVSNTATVLIVAPIALAAADGAGVAPAPVLMLVAVAGAASFLTPIATPANMMVMGPGGYRFGDYWKLGLVTMLAWLAVAVAVIPLVWPLAPA